MFVVGWLLLGVVAVCLLVVVCCVLCVVCCSLCVDRCWSLVLSVACYCCGRLPLLLVAGCCLVLFVVRVCCAMFALRCPSSDGRCCLVFAVRCLLLCVVCC